MSPIVAARLRIGGLLVLGLVLQTTVMPDLRVLGVCADLMLLCTVCAALVDGPELGGLVGFCAGLLSDLFLATTPLGLSALSFALIGFAIGSVRRTMLQEGWLLAPATALVGSAAGVITFIVAGVMVGQSQLTRTGMLDIVKTAVLVGVMNAIIAAPVCRLVAWAASGSRQAGHSGAEVSATAARRSSRLMAGVRPAHIQAGTSSRSGRARPSRRSDRSGLGR